MRGIPLASYLSKVASRMGRALWRNKKRTGALVIGALIIVSAAYAAWLQPPSAFPTDSVITIENGESLGEVITTLSESEAIRSPLALRALVGFIGGDDRIIAGDYYFAEPENAITLAYRITHGAYGIEPRRILIPEGATVREMADIFAGELPKFDKERFLDSAQDLEGYLFPDTYQFSPNATANQVLTTLRVTFNEKTKSLQPLVKASPYNLSEIVTMASLLEKEASDYETRRRIAGVLWKRLEIGMPLQVDAVFPYIIGRNTYEVTETDLDVDSPYNTYRYAGLPPGPIANPSLESIRAALEPIESDYLYYLADRSGNTYFSETFDEHVQKKRRYVN